MSRRATAFMLQSGEGRESSRPNNRMTSLRHGDVAHTRAQHQVQAMRLRGQMEPDSTESAQENMESLWKRPNKTPPEEEDAESTMHRALREAQEIAANLFPTPEDSSEEEPEEEVTKVPEQKKPEPVLPAVAPRRSRISKPGLRPGEKLPLKAKENVPEPAPLEKPERKPKVDMRPPRRKTTSAGCQVQASMGVSETQTDPGPVMEEKGVQKNDHTLQEDRRVRTTQTEVVETCSAEVQCEPSTADAALDPCIPTSEADVQTDPLPDDTLLVLLKTFAAEGGTVFMDFGKDKDGKDKKKLHMRIQNGVVAVQTGGGYTRVDDFIRRYAKKEDIYASAASGSEEEALLEDAAREPSREGTSGPKPRPPAPPSKVQTMIKRASRISRVGAAITGGVAAEKVRSR